LATLAGLKARDYEASNWHDLLACRLASDDGIVVVS